jgi:hypothetical protein
VLPGGYSSWTNGINARGLIVGQSQDGEFDPLTGAPDFVATVWDHGKVKNLGTFGGGNSIAITATDQNFVMGAAENGIIDTSGFVGFDGVRKSAPLAGTAARYLISERLVALGHSPMT